MQLAPKEIEDFRSALLIPRATKAYGIDTRELRHNAFLDFMLGQSLLGAALVRAIASRASGFATANKAEWTSLATANVGDIKIVERVCNSSASNRTRPDEIIRCVIEPRTKVNIVVEMKVNAPGDEKQLEQYVKHEKEHRSDAAVLGLHLSIRGIDDDAQRESPLLNASAYRRCIEEAMSDPALALHENTRWLINDYRETLYFLNLCDNVIIQWGEWLRNDGYRDEVVGNWLTDTWSWVEQRIAREIAVRSKNVLDGWSGHAYATTDGSNVDFDFEDKLDVRSGSDSASLYLQWKVGKGLGLHAIAGGYPDSQPGSVKIMNSLFERACAELRLLWNGRNGTDFSGRLGRKSVLVGRLVAETWDIGDILRVLQDEVLALQLLAKRVVDDLNAELALGT